MTEKEQYILNEIEKAIFEGQISNEFLVENIKLSAQYLGLKTIKQYANDNKITPQAVYKAKKYIKLIDTKFIIDNN